MTEGRLAEIVARVQTPDFFFVNIGANDGVSNDPIYPFLGAYGWRGIAVEPVPFVYDELRRNYARFPAVAVENAAIAATPRPFFCIPPEAKPPGFTRQIGSLHLEYIQKTIGLMRMYEFQGPVAEGLEQAVVRIDVPCLTFEALLAKHAVQRIDFLNIDAENADFEIISMVDFARWRPAILCLETSELTPDQQTEVQHRLAAADYQYLEPFDLFSHVYVQRAALPPAA